MNEKKPFNPQTPKQEGPKPQQGPKPYLEHGEIKKRDDHHNDRYKPSYDPKPGDDK